MLAEVRRILILRNPVVPAPVSLPVSVPERQGEYEERASCGRAIFGDFGSTPVLKRCLRPEIAKGGNHGERPRRIATKRSRGRSERACMGTDTETGAGTTGFSESQHSADLC
jgi:hypothetical protein